MANANGLDDSASGDTVALSYLCKSDPEYAKYSSLYDAAIGGHEDKVEKFLKDGLNVNYQDPDGDTVLHMAASTNNIHVVEILLRAGADVNAKNKAGCSILYEAAQGGDVAVVRAILDKGANFKEKDKYGDTVLHKAANWGQHEVVAELCRAGAPINGKNMKESTPLHEACSGGHLEAVEVLIENRADVNAQMKYGYTPLHKAAMGGHELVVDALLKGGAQVNLQNEYEQTPLHIAAKKGKRKSVRVLLKHGADPTIKNEIRHHVMGIRQMVFGLLLTGAASLTFMMTYTQKSIATRPQHREMQRATGLIYEVPSSLPKEIPDFVLDIMKNATNKGWRFNQTAISRLRSDLERECNTSTGFVLTRTNQPLNSTFKYFHGGKMRIMTPSLWEKMPEDVPFARKRLKRCSIVGSSTILINSSCGEFIDSSDLIVRFNFAPMKEALAGDIGRRTTLMVANGDSIRHKFGTKVSAKRFVHAVKSYGSDYSLLVNPFSSQTHTSHSLLVQDRLRTRTNHSVYHLHPAWLGWTNKFWQRKRVFGKDKSTGFKIASAALVFCDEVHLLGFWPYLVDLQGRKIPFHYYEKGKHGFSQRWHNMDSEFRRLFRLFGEGIINIVAGKCKKR